MTSYKINTTKNKSKMVKIAAVLLVPTVVILSVVIYQQRNTPTAPSSAAQEVKTTSEAESAQEDFSTGTERTIENTDQEKGEGTIIDNRGQIAVTPDKSSWIVSSTGEISLYSPLQNQRITNGDIISGESKLNQVNYRVIDNVSGVISEGQISVIDGKFSGSIQFNTTAKEGRIDLYAVTEDGLEYSNVEVSIKF